MATGGCADSRKTREVPIRLRGNAPWHRVAPMHPDRPVRNPIMPLLRALVVLACLTIGLPFAHAQDGAPDIPAVDAAAWGPYARLLERSWQLGEGYRVTWEWLSPGQELREQWINPHDGKVVQTNVIRPGDTPGRLQLTSSLLGMNLKWQGRVASADEVVWAREGMVKLPYRLRFADDGQVLYEGVKLKDELVTDVKYMHVMKPMALDAAAPAVVAVAMTADAPLGTTDAPVTAAGVEAPASPTTFAQADAPLQTPMLASEQIITGLGPLSAFAGQTFTWCTPSQVGGKNCYIRFIETGDGLQICFFPADFSTSCEFTYAAMPSDKKPGELKLTNVTSRKGEYYVSTGARWKESGQVLEFTTRKKYYESLLTEAIKLTMAPHTGWVSNADFWVARDGTLRWRSYGWTAGMLGGKSDAYDTTYELKPVTPALVQEYSTIYASWKVQGDYQRQIDAQRRREEEAQREANFAAFMGGLNAVATTVQQDMAEVDRANQRVADARRAMEEAQAREQARQQAEQAEQLRARQQAQQSALAQQQTNAQVAEQARQQAAREAEQRRVAQQQVADQARRKQKEEAERKRQAAAQKLAEDQARQRQQQEWQQSLLQARNSLRLRADICLGGSGRYYVIGPKTSVKGCATVHYEARCTGTPQGAGVQGTQHNYIGGSCMGVGDAIAIPGSPLSCPVEQVIVRVTDVTGCQ